MFVSSLFSALALYLVETSLGHAIPLFVQERALPPIDALNESKKEEVHQSN
jgi:hypothetical protein